MQWFDPALNPLLARFIQPVAEPEKAFGWGSGAGLSSASALSGVQGVGTQIVAITLADEGFYAVDFTCTIMPVTANANRGITLDFRDANQTSQWAQIFQYFGATITPPAGIFVQPTIFLHLPAAGQIRATVAVAMTAGDFAAASIALRKLYGDQM